MMQCYLIVYQNYVIGKRAVGDPQPTHVPPTWIAIDEATYHATQLGASLNTPTKQPRWRNSDQGLRTIEERLLRLEAHLGLL